MKKRKIAWKDTPEGIAHYRKLGRMTRQRSRERALLKATFGESEPTKTETNDNHAYYVFGKIETTLEYYALINGVPLAPLTERVAELLRHKASG